MRAAFFTSENEVEGPGSRSMIIRSGMSILSTRLIHSCTVMHAWFARYNKDGLSFAIGCVTWPFDFGTLTRAIQSGKCLPISCWTQPSLSIPFGNRCSMSGRFLTCGIIAGATDS